MANDPFRLHHKAPSWVKDGSIFHIRIRTDLRQKALLTTPALATDRLKSVQLYHAAGKWWRDLFLLMPDHLHALLAFPREPGMAATIREWKRGAARLQRVKSQENFFDHRLRSDKLGAETWHYIRRNPVVKELCPDEDSWTYWWSGTLAAGGADGA